MHTLTALFYFRVRKPQKNCEYWQSQIPWLIVSPCNYPVPG